MIKSKYLTKITIIFVCLSLFTCAGIVYMADNNTKTKVLDYENKLFGDNILSIDIRVEEEDWQSILDNATAKEYISGDLIINGVTFNAVGIRTKGNSSLMQVARMEDNDRYSLQFKFNYYVKGQTCYGLDSFCINNLISDSTYMKDYIAYDIMKYVGVDTPLTNYANVTVNGEDFGFCLALERYDKSFLDRVYNISGGQLYNVKIAMGQRVTPGIRSSSQSFCMRLSEISHFEAASCTEIKSIYNRPFCMKLSQLYTVKRITSIVR